MKGLSEGYCLVLSGGGAKGVYHLGVWKALGELGIEVQAFTGTSIGAVIAGLLAQDTGESFDDLGESIRLDSIVALPESFVEEGKLSVNRKALANAQKLFRSLMEHKGLDTSPLRTLLLSRIDEGRIRNSGKDLGIVTINLNSLKPREMFIEEMEEGSVIDYLMASAAFPGFEQPRIEGEKYLDGGIFDNIPYAMARQRGYRRIIISDISGLGRNRKPEIEGSLTIYIKNSIHMGGVLDFDQDFMRDFERLGYLDTMRTFGRYKGYSYFILPDDDAEASFAAGMRKPSADAGSQETALADTVGESPDASPKFPKYMLHDRDLLLKYLECAALILEIPRIREYSYEDLTAAIEKSRLEEEDRIAELVKGGAEMRAEISARLKEAIDSRSLAGSPYYYFRLIDEFMPKAAASMLGKALVGFFPELPAGLEYLGRLMPEKGGILSSD